MRADVCAALEGVYRSFEAPTPPHIDACPCCVSDSQVAILLSRPVREITADELTAYASAVLLTTGDAADFRYFLPRMLELCLSDRCWWPDLEVLLGKLPMAEWEAWPSGETRALMTLFDRGFEEALETSSSNPLQLDVDSWICALARAEVPLERFLRRLEDPDAGDALVRFFDANKGCLGTGGLSNAFWDWDRHRAAAEQVVRWFHSPAVQAALGRARRSSR